MVTGVEFARTRLDAQGRLTLTEQIFEIAADMVLKAIGQTFVADPLNTDPAEDAPAVRDGRIVVDAERRSSERYLGNTGRVEWLASFAPIAPAELRAFAAGACTPAELDGDLIAELAHGLALALGGYAEMGLQSFNLAIYGAPPGSAGYPLNLRLACRSNPRPLYRSDSTFLERLHWEGAVDLAPETVARQIGERFRG